MLRDGMTQDGFMSTHRIAFPAREIVGDEALRSGFHRHHITRPSKSFSRFENFGKRCGVRLCWHFLRMFVFLK
jgi:hypothetical protein